MRASRLYVPVVITLMCAAAGCGGDGSAPATAAGAPTASAPAGTPPPVTTPSPSVSPTPSTPPASARPVPVRFAAQVKTVSRTTLKYSWHKGCPVAPSGLRLIEMTYWGMDHKPHPGQLVVNARAADDVVKVFRRLFGQRYPIRRMELVDVYKGSDFDSIEADNTSAFNCRSATGSSNWSQHAYGLAIDINPCENPYVTSGGDIAHKDCRKYGNRSNKDPGVIRPDDTVVRAFKSIGWGWGGTWSGTRDYQHFSSTGR